MDVHRPRRTWRDDRVLEAPQPPHWFAVTSDNHFAYVANEQSNDV